MSIFIIIINYLSFEGIIKKLKRRSSCTSLWRVFFPQGQPTCSGSEFLNLLWQPRSHDPGNEVANSEILNPSEILKVQKF